MGKYAFSSFHSAPIIFMRVMLNALDLNQRGHDVKVILEDDAVVLSKRCESLTFTSLASSRVFDPAEGSSSNAHPHQE